jgi:hypothetical protein
MSDERWITVTEAAEILKMTTRQVNRYGNELGKIRTKRSGRRVLYLLADVVALADELRVDIRPGPTQSPLARPIEETRDYLRQLVEAQQRVEERLQQIEEAERRRLPPPAGPSKEEWQQWLREVLTEQEAARRTQEPPRSRIQINAVNIAIALMVIAVVVIIYIALRG